MNSVKGQVWDQVDDQVRVRVWGQVIKQVWVQVRDELNE